MHFYAIRGGQHTGACKLLIVMRLPPMVATDSFGIVSAVSPGLRPLTGWFFPHAGILANVLGM